MPKALLFSYVWPEPESSAAGVRTMAILEGLSKLDWTFTVYSPCADNPARARLEALGFTCKQVEANDSSLGESLHELAPEFVIFDRFVLEEQFGFLVARECPDAMRVIDTQDLHFLRQSRGAAINKSEFFWDEKAVLRECASIYRSDLTLLISPHELALLKEHFHIPSELLELAKISVPSIGRSLLPFSERKNFCFIGNYRHAPNHDGALWFCKRIWPKIRAHLPQSEFHLFGSYPPKEIAALDNPAMGIRFTGPVKDAQAALSTYRVNLAPLRFGAGVKGKIADGWAVGTPCVSTSIGQEGMGIVAAWGGIVADGEADFAAGAVALYTEEPLWEKLSRQGRASFSQDFSLERNALILSSKLLELKNNLAVHRARNLVGRILWREESRSTEYFSRWIEEKNK